MKLIRATIQDAKNLWKMQIVAFQDLYAKYQDPETSPATETLEKTMTRLEQPYTYYYYINVEDCIVGVMQNKTDKGTLLVSKSLPVVNSNSVNRLFSKRKTNRYVSSNGMLRVFLSQLRPTNA